MFVNRTAELAALERWWSSTDARMAMVWGRRRVGKTALVRRFAEGRQTVFHTGASRGQGTELTVLARQVSGLGVTGVRDLVARGYTDWDDALDHVAVVAEREPRRANTREPCCTRSRPAPPATTRSGTRSGRTRPVCSIVWSPSG